MHVKEGYRGYIVSRIARVWPLHLLTLLICMLAFNLVPYDVGSWKRLFANAFLLHSWIPYSDWFYSYNWVSWSISTELAFYLAFPALLYFMRKNWLIVAGLASLLLVLMIGICLVLNLPPRPSVEVVSSSGLLYINPLSRIVEFMAGMLTWRAFNSSFKGTASCLRSTVIEVGVLALLVVAMSFTHMLWKYDSTLIPGGVMGWLATAGSFPFIALLVWVVAKQQGLVSRVLSHKLFVYLGEISFSIYMVHQIILRVMAGRFSELLLSSPFMSYAIYWFLTILVSALLYHLVETPCRILARANLSGRKPQFA